MNYSEKQICKAHQDTLSRKRHPTSRLLSLASEAATAALIMVPLALGAYNAVNALPNAVNALPNAEPVGSNVDDASFGSEANEHISSCPDEETWAPSAAKLNLAIGERGAAVLPVVSENSQHFSRVLPDRVNRDLGNLHPELRWRVAALLEQLSAEGHQFRLFEGMRHPRRQESLYAKGRTKPGRKVTWVRAYHSLHQFGLAADLVLYVDGRWSWKTKGEFARSWLRLQELAKKLGLETLGSNDLPHVQLSGANIRDLRAGRYPSGGDMSWVTAMRQPIIDFRSIGGTAPPIPVDPK